jgi:proline dehydrogenase
VAPTATSFVKPEETPAPLVLEDTRVAFAHRSTFELWRARLLFWSFAHPFVVRLGAFFTTWFLRLRLPGFTALIRKTLFAHFCGGESLASCEPAVEALAQGKVLSILDYSVEGEKTEAGFDATLRETLASVDYAADHPHVAFSVFKVTGLVRYALLEKLSLTGSVLTKDEQSEWARAKARMEAIGQRVSEKGGRLLIDAEETWTQPIVDATVEEMMARFNRSRAVVFNTYQLYRRAALPNLAQGFERAVAGGYFFGAKLVRGAYLERERARAAVMGYPDPIQPDKASTDRDYDAAVRLCLDHLDRAAVFVGTHNDESCQNLVREIHARGLPRNDPRIFMSQLYGMSDHLSFNLGQAGFNVAKYMPYGPLRSVLPYLIRRAEENSGIAGQGSRELMLVNRELRRRRG